MNELKVFENEEFGELNIIQYVEKKFIDEGNLGKGQMYLLDLVNNLL